MSCDFTTQRYDHEDENEFFYRLFTSNDRCEKVVDILSFPGRRYPDEKNLNSGDVFIDLGYGFHIIVPIGKLMKKATIAAASPDSTPGPSINCGFLRSLFKYIAEHSKASLISCWFDFSYQDNHIIVKIKCVNGECDVETVIEEITAKSK